MVTVHAALDDRLVTFEGVDGDWRARERLTDARPQCLAVSPEAPERLFCGTFDHGLRRSADGGDSWERVGADALHDRVTAATVSPRSPVEVWVGTEPSAVFRSADGGDGWEAHTGLTDLPSADEWYFPPRPHTHHVRWLELDPHDPDRLYVGIEAGAFVLSDDGGDSWRERPPGSRRDNHSLATHPDAPGRVYAAAGDGYAESDDGGERWDHPQAGLDHRYCWSVRPDPADPDTVVMSSASGAHRAHSPGSAESYVYRREGGGEWERAMDGLPDPEGMVRAELATAGPGEFWALTTLGLFRSTDAGRSWTAVDVPWPDAYRDLVPRGLAVLD